MGDKAVIRPEQIPDEVVEAAVKAEYDYHFRHSCWKWPENCYERERDGWRISQRYAIAAAINAWEGCAVETYDNGERGVFLPLPQKGDA